MAQGLLRLQSQIRSPGEESRLGLTPKVWSQLTGLRKHSPHHQWETAGFANPVDLPHSHQYTDGHAGAKLSQSRQCDAGRLTAAVSLTHAGQIKALGQSVSVSEST
jgi:hypothetical protein